uniref:Uncharacterized protein n=1 Tax=Cacopsylla melanoneura TaxID=428564 RepID=A0A8D8ULX9_9HEMI
MQQINITEEEAQDRRVWRGKKASRLQMTLAVSKHTNYSSSESDPNIQFFSLEVKLGISVLGIPSSIILAYGLTFRIGIKRVILEMWRLFIKVHELSNRLAAGIFTF